MFSERPGKVNTCVLKDQLHRRQRIQKHRKERRVALRSIRETETYVYVRMVTVLALVVVGLKTN